MCACERACTKMWNIVVLSGIWVNNRNTIYWKKEREKNCSVLNCCCFLFFLITLLTLSKKREKKSSLIPVSHSSISLQSSEKHKLTRFELSTLVEHDLPTQTYMYMKKCVLMYASVYVCTYVCVGVDVWNLECRLVWYLNILTLVFCQDNLWDYGHGLN